MSVSLVQVKADGMCICFIDDCQDADVPLAELNFTSKYKTRFKQKKEAANCTKLICSLANSQATSSMNIKKWYKKP